MDREEVMKSLEKLEESREKVRKLLEEIEEMSGDEVDEADIFVL